MSAMKEKSMKRKLFGGDNEDGGKLESTPGDKKRRRKNVEAPKHYPLSVRQQLAMLMQMTSAENSPEPASPPPSTPRRTPGSSGRKDKIHKRNERGETLLHLSTIRGDLDSMKELIKQGAEVNVQDFAGWTPLHEACNHGHHEITQYLLEVGANVNSRGLEDDTPLHDAVTNAHKDLVELLLKHGANPLLANKRGERPLDMADDEEIKELLQKEVMSSDESEPASPSSEEERREKIWESPGPKVNEIKNIHKKEKTRTTSTCSSSSRELFKSSTKKKKQKKKEKSKAILTVDSSSNSEDSDDEPLIQKRAPTGSQLKPFVAIQSTPKANTKQRPVGKTPTLNATPVSSLSKSKSSSKSTKSSKVKKNTSQSKISQNLMVSSSSSSLSSDSEHETIKKSNPVKHKSSFVSVVLGENGKEKLKDNKPRVHKEKLNSNAVQSGKVSTPELVKRHKTYSSEEEAHLCKGKNKNPKPNEAKQKSANFPSFPKTSKYASFDISTSDNNRSQTDMLGITGNKTLKDETDESIYDFSLSTEDFTSVGDISLKHSTVGLSSSTKPKDKASELFDTLCLGKSNDDVPSYKDFSLLKRKSVECKRQEIPHSLYGDFSRESDKTSTFSYETGSTVEKSANKTSLSKLAAKVTTEETNLDRRVDNENLSPSVKPNSTLLTANTTPPKSLSLITQTVEKVLIKTGDGLEEKQRSTTVPTLFSVIKTEVKVEKKVKEKRDVTQTTISTPSQSSKSVENLEVSTESKQANVKKEQNRIGNVGTLNDVVPKETTNEKEKDLYEKEVKVQSVKKKKKHKHSKTNHESPLKIKDRTSRTPSETSQPETSTITEKDSTTPKQTGEKNGQKIKFEAQKSGHVSRKSSLESKNETHSSSATPQQAKKKLKMSDSVDSETPKSSSKSSTPKSSKPISNSDKQSSLNSSKKDKTKTKNITLLSDDNSFFLSELEKSSRQREIEKMKLKKKKKKLLQQQKLKSQRSVDAGSKDSGPSSTTVEKKTPITSDQKMDSQLSFHFEPSETDKGRSVHPQAKPDPPLVPPRDANKSALFSLAAPFSHPLSTQHLSMQNLRQHDPIHNEPQPVQAHNFDVFKSPLTNRSISQVEEHPNAQPVSWLPLPSDKLIYSSPEKLPVQRSLSFSGQPSQVGIAQSPARNHPTIVPQLSSDKPVHENTIHPLHTGTTPLLGDAYNFTTVPTHQHGYPENASVTINDSLLDRKTTDGIPVEFAGNKESHEAASLVPNLLDVSSSSQLEASDVQSVPLINVAASSVIHWPGKTNNNSKNDVATKPEELVQLEKENETIEMDKKEESNKNAETAKETVLDVQKETENGSEMEAKVEKDESKEERKLAVQKYIADRLSKVVIEEAKPQRLPVFIPMEKLKNVSKKDPILDHLNVYEEWAVIQKQINERRKKYAATVIPQAPQCYWEFMTFTGGYLLSGSRESWLSVPMLAPPPSLSEEMQALFVVQEKERVKLRLQHASQREKLIVACEQEIMRVHSRAARTNQNQLIPLSACSVLLDREVYNVERRNKKINEGENGTSRTASIRDRFNARMFLSWLQDVDDKYEKMKNALLSRQRHEAQALHAVQRTEWLLKLQEVEHQGQQRWTTAKPEDVTEVNVPLVNISDDFDLLPS